MSRSRWTQPFTMSLDYGTWLNVLRVRTGDDDDIPLSIADRINAGFDSGMTSKRRLRNRSDLLSLLL